MNSSPDEKIMKTSGTDFGFDLHTKRKACCTAARLFVCKSGPFVECTALSLSPPRDGPKQGHM